jgi:hypothetical protein
MATSHSFSELLAQNYVSNNNFRPLVFTKPQVKHMLDLIATMGASADSDPVLNLYAVETNDSMASEPIVTLRYVLYKKDATGTKIPLAFDFKPTTAPFPSIPHIIGFTVTKKILRLFLASGVTTKYLAFLLQQNPDGVISLHAPYLRFTGGGGAPGGEAGSTPPA